jgi:hypothetical protein
VAGVCRGARPKIQKWIGEAGEENADLMGEDGMRDLWSSVTAAHVDGCC